MSSRKGSGLDPAVFLNDMLMFHIFSFVGGKLPQQMQNNNNNGSNGNGNLKQSTQDEEDEDELWIEEEVGEDDDKRLEENDPRFPNVDEESFLLNVWDAAKFYYRVARVSRGWKRILDASIKNLLAPLQVNLDQFAGNLDVNTWRVLPCLLWICRHKLSLGSLYAIRDAKQLDLPLLVYLLRESDTTNTTRIWVPVRFTTEERSVWQDSSSPYFNIIDKQMTPREYQDVIAKQCPKLKKLCICLRIDGDENNHDYPDAISPSLFALPTLTELSIVLEVAKSFITLTMERLFFTKLIQNLPMLRHLTIHCRRLELQHWVFHVKSNSLRQLLVPNFTKRACFSVDCPKLQFFRCKGYFSGPGQIPAEQQLLVYQKVVEVVNAPENCVALIDHFQDPTEHPVGMPLRDILDAAFLPAHPGFIPTQFIF